MLIIYPKRLENVYCRREAPLNQQIGIWNTKTGIWKGKNVRFDITLNSPYVFPKHYSIYDLQTDELLESDIEINDLYGKNFCVGHEYNIIEQVKGDRGYGTLSACIGIPVPICNLDKDYASKTNGYYMKKVDDPAM